MSLVFAAALAASTAAVPVCSWDRPGQNVFRGDVVAAVDRYADIPAPVRARLKARMADYRYDEVATIRRDSISGRHAYGDLRDMHFGQGQVCRTVTRDKWAAAAEERGLVYCDSGHCLIVPTVCRNVARVTRAPGPPAVPATAGGDPADPVATAPADDWDFDPPSAGRRPSESPQSFATASAPGALPLGAPVYANAAPLYDLVDAAAPPVGSGFNVGPRAFADPVGSAGPIGPGDPAWRGIPGPAPLFYEPGVTPGLGSPGPIVLPGPALLPVSEPPAVALLVAGLAALLLRRRRR